MCDLFAYNRDYGNNTLVGWVHFVRDFSVRTTERQTEDMGYFVISPSTPFTDDQPDLGIILLQKMFYKLDFLLKIQCILDDTVSCPEHAFHPSPIPDYLVSGGIMALEHSFGRLGRIF